MKLNLDDNIKDEKVMVNKRRMKKGIFLIGLTTLVLIVSTYAWFVGLTKVTINEFELNVEATQGLSLSLDGNSFTGTLNINVDTIKNNLATAYASNTNNWLVEGLVPMSTIGELDLSTSRMKIFTKTSMTSNKGGYKLIADLANGRSEVDGYIAFDLFIKNEASTDYTTTYNKLDDEGVYLTAASAATIQEAGEGVPEGGDGIENSIRVAFMQIGRINMTGENIASKAQAISCSSTAESGVTQLCNQPTAGRGITWNIWEPNDLKHNAASVEHFSRVCLKRTGADTYSGNCNPIADEQYAYTYASNANIASSDNVNIYDGLNDYSIDNISSSLTKMEYFRDSTNKANADEIFYLAPASITKVRVYIYIEGQDVDNYDLGAMGKKIYVSFGFSKNKYVDA